MASFTLDDLKAVVGLLAAVFEEKTDYLNDLDTRLGDGDHGRSMNLGFRALSGCSKEERLDSMSALLMEGGMQFNEAAGSTIGILMMSALRAAGKVIAQRETLGLGDAARMLEAAIEAMMKRGKARTGQKTILDSLSPACDVMKRAAGDPGTTAVGGTRDDANRVIRDAIEAAEAGAEHTRTMTPSVGRARWFAERSQDEIDPGAVSGSIIMKTVGEYLLEAMQQ